MSDGTPGVNGTPEKLPGTRDFELPFLEILVLASIDAKIAKNLCSEYVVPENIHTPTTEGIGNSRGVGGSKAQEIPERGGGGVVSEFTFPDGQV